MRRSAKAEYACLAILELARHYGSGRPVPVRDIAGADDLPDRYLNQLMLQLKTAGLVGSMRGNAGGYWLLRSPAAISLAEVLSLFEQSASSAKQQSGNAQPPGKRLLASIWDELEAVEQQRLRAITFAELLLRLEHESGMYHI